MDVPTNIFYFYIKVLCEKENMSANVKIMYMNDWIAFSEEWKVHTVLVSQI